MSRLRRLWNVVRRPRLDDELRQEIETHLALIEDDERAQGSSAQQARHLARARFGNPFSHRERALDAVMATGFESACKEMVFAARRLVRSPAFTLAAALTLALAIGANVSIFAVVQRFVLNPLPYPDSDRVLQLDHGAHRLNLPSGMGMTRGLFYQYAERARTLAGVAIYATDSVTLTGDGDPQQIRVTRATATLAPVLRVWPTLGRWFREEEGVLGARRVAVLSHGLWIRRYGSDPGIVGRSVILGGLPTEVVGVMPAGYAFPDSQVDVWIPEQMTRLMGFGIWSYRGVARLRDGVTAEDARVELNRLIADLPRAYPGDPLALGNTEDIKLFSAAATLKEATIGNVARTLWILLASVGLVLLIACTNVANLFLVRSEARQREVATRRALGAGRLGIARYFLAESVLLSMAGGAIGLALAWGAVHVLVAAGPTTLPRLGEVRLDGVAVAYTCAVSLLAALAFGAIPLWRGASLAVSLHESGRSNTASRGRHRTRQLLMGGQVALALLLLVASGLMVRSFQKLRAVDPGFDARSALTFTVGLPGREYPTRAAAVAAHQAILDRLSALPGATAVSASTCLPLAGGGCLGNTVRVQGRAIPPGTVPPLAVFSAVASGYFEDMGIRLIRGRSIDRGDIERREPVVVVDEVFAERMFPNQNPIGEHVASNRPPATLTEEASLTWLTIVGVVSRTPTRILADPNPTAQVYMPMSIAGGPDVPASSLVGPDIAVMTYVVRSALPPAALTPSVRRAIDTVDPKLAIARVRTLQNILDDASGQMAFTMALIAIAASVAVMLGVIGIYGVMSYIVTQRTGEIGVRLALGAEPGGVAAMIVRQGAYVALSGVMVGLVIAFTGSRLIESLLYGVSPRDPGVFVATPCMLLGVALVACWLPARRAARLNPLEALRTGE
jgi:putative ABC transport system permease protein